MVLAVAFATAVTGLVNLLGGVSHQGSLVAWCASFLGVMLGEAGVTPLKTPRAFAAVSAGAVFVLGFVAWLRS